MKDELKKAIPELKSAGYKTAELEPREITIGIKGPKGKVTYSKDTVIDIILEPADNLTDKKEFPWPPILKANNLKCKDTNIFAGRLILKQISMIKPSASAKAKTPGTEKKG